MCLCGGTLCEEHQVRIPQGPILAKIENSINVGWVTATWGLGGSYSAGGKNALENQFQNDHIYSAYACVWNTLYISHMVGASLSEPHTYDKYAATICIFIYIYVYMCCSSCRIVLFAHSQWLPLANLCRLFGAEGFQGRMHTKQG